MVIELVTKIMTIVTTTAVAAVDTRLESKGQR